MAIKFVITIDTEEDQWDIYSAKSNTVDNIFGLLSLQKIFDKYNAVPTYLVNWPVITCHTSSQIIKKLYNEHNCEIGTHCHPWNTPPSCEEINVKNSMMCNLPYKAIEQKMGRLHQAIVKTLNVEPLCFRAGRWGVGSNVAKCIQQLGYTIDTSITPFFDWSEYGGPNYNCACTYPYHFEASNILQQHTNGSLFEVPASVGFLQRDFEFSNKIRMMLLSTGMHKLRLIGILDKLKLLNRRWLSPELSSSEDMIKLINVFVLNGHRVLNFTLHSTSLLPGKTQYVRSEEDLDNFMKRIETVLAYCNHKNFEFVSLSKILDCTYNDCK